MFPHLDSALLSTACCQRPPLPCNISWRRLQAVPVFTWNVAAGANSYNLYRGTALAQSATPIKTGLTAEGTPDTGLDKQTTYYARSLYVNGAGESAPSNEGSLIPSVALRHRLLLPPSFTAAAVPASQINLDVGQ